MKTIKWNVGIMIIRLGYLIRGEQRKPVMKWNIGAGILRVGYKLRGKIPMKTWKGNHV